MAKLSIIVTTHERPILLERALRSILSLGEDIQIVLCADEGSAATREVAFRLLRDSDIFLCLPGYRGPAATRNAGLMFAQGDFVSFLDDDDTVNPALADKLLPQLKGEAVYIANYIKQFEMRHPDGSASLGETSKKRTNRRPFAELQVRNFVALASFFAPNGLAKQARFRPELPISEDWDYLLQLQKLSEFRHVDVAATNWHIVQEGEVTRDGGSKALRAKAAQLIYAANPLSDPHLLAARAERLKKLGVKQA